MRMHRQDRSAAADQIDRSLQPVALRAIRKKSRDEDNFLGRKFGHQETQHGFLLLYSCIALPQKIDLDSLENHDNTCIVLLNYIRYTKLHAKLQFELLLHRTAIKSLLESKMRHWVQVCNCSAGKRHAVRVTACVMLAARSSAWLARKVHARVEVRSAPFRALQPSLTEEHSDPARVRGGARASNPASRLCSSPPVPYRNSFPRRSR